MSQVSLAIIGLIAGLIFGLNPTLISIISVYVASMIGRQTKNQQIALNGLLYLTIFATFVLFVASLSTTILTSLSPLYSDSTNLIIAVIGTIIGTNLIRWYFWPKKIIPISANTKTILHIRTTKKSGPYNNLILAIISLYATLSTLGIAILLLSSYSVVLGPTAIVWGLPFSIGLILPMYCVIALILHGTKASAIIAWKEKSKNTIRLYSGLFLIALSWLLLFIIASGRVINI